MTAIDTMPTTSVVSELPCLSSIDHDDDDDDVMVEKVMTETSDAEEHVSSRAVSPLDGDSFDQWQQQDHEWDDVVAIMGRGDDDDQAGGCHDFNIEQVFAEGYDNYTSQSLLDSAIDTININTVPSIDIDEFLVRHNDTNEDMNATLNWYSQDFQVPRSLKSTFNGDASEAHAVNAASTSDKQVKGTTSSHGSKTLTTDNCSRAVNNSEIHAEVELAQHYSNFAMSSVLPPTSGGSADSAAFQQLYRKRLHTLQKSMRQSHKSRKSLCMRSSRVPDKYSRRTSISQVLYSVDCSSRWIDTSFLDPAYLLNEGRLSPPKSNKATRQLRPNSFLKKK
jgi:hypothetical protein